MDSQEFKRIINVNLITSIQLIKEIYPVFIERGAGLLVNINSLAGKMPNELEAAYCASKYGLRGFMDSFQNEANRNNVRMINVYLGAMQTAITDHRPDQALLIDPDEAASIIFGLCEDYPSLRITEISLLRRRY